MDLYEQLTDSILVHDPKYQFLLQNAQQNGVTTLDFLTLPSQQLVKLANRSINEINEFQKLLKQEFNREVIENNPILPVRSAKRPQCFTTGDAKIDSLLNGGIYTHCITEVFGESSTGKSQFAMQLALSVQLPEELKGAAGQCVYIGTEGDLPTQRLESLINATTDFKENVSQRNIFTVTCNDWASQNHILSVQLPILLERNDNIKLVIIDSISHHLRVELESKTFKASLNNRFEIDKMAQNLLELSQKHGLAVVVTNQVGDKPLPDRPYKQGVMDYDYQLGFMTGWKDSSIYYRHLFNSGCEGEDVLSDDEDYAKVAIAHEKILLSQQQHQQQYQRQQSVNLQKDQVMNSRSSPLSTTSAAKSENLATSNVKVSQTTSPPSGTPTATVNAGAQSATPLFRETMYKRKRRVDTKIPNLGLTWANHLTTRILLSKSYKAAPLICKGDFDFNKVMDTSNFWQVNRVFKVVFSTYARQGQTQYSIQSRGIVSVDDTQN
ncbi:HCL349Cp [Eremothecium sinecaudum]|uniref:HCL349Cp n=1 Tax=Eremothecium sinecaudum TaxID=45286 RepID=A0A120K1W6_9SACH|nr:HCL349Cp [Eremothecium sinecaudum]AMD19802.1 HCL349Cp [Eremothecium sinecaudum]